MPALFRDRFIKDVTANYFGENEVSVSVQSAYEDYIYLGVFSPGGWIPVDIAHNNIKLIETELDELSGRIA